MNTNEDIKTYQPLANREYKSSVFTSYFSIPEHAADLYRSLSDDPTIQPQDISFVTLENAIYLNRKNDFAFTSQGKVLIIGEHQSTLNPNMPLRSAIYYGRTMERLIPAAAMYKTKRLSIPTPEFYIFYNGTHEQPTESILKLSDSYIEKVIEPMLDLTVRMININPVNHHPLLQKSRSLYEYSSFVQKVRDYQKPDEPLTNAIETAMHDCIQDGIMVDFLSKHGSEVRNMLFTEFNMDEALRIRGEEGYEDGLADGKSLGLTEGKSIGLSEGKSSEIRTIRKKLAQNMPITEIAEWLELDESYISSIAVFIQKYPEKNDVQIAELYLKEYKMI